MLIASCRMTAVIMWDGAAYPRARSRHISRRLGMRRRRRRKTLPLNVLHTWWHRRWGGFGGCHDAVNFVVENSSLKLGVVKVIGENGGVRRNFIARPSVNNYTHLNDVQTTAAVFCLSSSGSSARSSRYSRQSGVSDFWCHRLERSASPRLICAVTRGFQTTTQDLSVFPFLPIHYHMTRVNITIRHCCWETCGPCNNLHYLRYLLTYIKLCRNVLRMRR